MDMVRRNLFRARARGPGGRWRAVAALLLGGCLPAAAAAAPATRFAEQPDLSILSRNYPPSALAANVSSRVVMRCGITQEGRLDPCTVLSVEQPGYGFEPAALRVVRYFRLERPAEGFVEGASFQLAIRFEMMDEGQRPPDQRLVALTVDDLPWQSLGGPVPDDLPAWHGRLMAQLRAARVPVAGFVNEGKLEVDGTPVPERVQMLRDWLDLRAELGNHTWGHVDLHAVGDDAFRADILRGERVLRPLLAERGQSPRWFRHPYLRAGRSPEQRAQMRHFLSGHGYRVAPVTVDNSEWIWAGAYRKVLAEPAGRARDRQLRRLREGYVAYMIDKLDYYEGQSRDLLGYLLPQVWLVHANELNADTLATLVSAAKAKGYRFTTLDEALLDPAYERHEEGYDGPWGPSWLHRWAMAEGKARDFFAGEPETPRWVLDLAGVASE